MKLSQLLNTYEFHDCDVITPFKVADNTITITFDKEVIHNLRTPKKD